MSPAEKKNLVMMFGDDSLSMREELALWQKAFTFKHDSTNLELLDADSDFSSISSAILSAPFLSEKRLIILKNFQKDAKNEAKLQMKTLLPHLPETNILVFAENGEPDKRSVLYKFLVQNATLKHFPKPEPYALPDWLLQRARKHHANLNKKTAQELISHTGTDLNNLDNELKKLAIFAEGQEINSSMFQTLVSQHMQAEIFDMTDKLARKDLKSTIKLIKNLQEAGHEGPYIFAMLARQFRLMLEMKSLSEAGSHPKEIALQMKVHPFVVSKTLANCRYFSHTELKNALSALLEIDKKLKTGQIHFRPNEESQYMLAMESLIIRTFQTR